MSARDQRFKAVHRGGPLSLEHQRLLAIWAADCAEHVIGLFTTEQSDDDRPETAINLAREWTGGNITVGDARTAAFAAHAAARDANEDAAIFAARAAGHAVATVHMADHSINAAAYALKAASSESGADHTDAIAKEHDWQLQRIPTNVRELILSAFAQQHSHLVP